MYLELLLGAEQTNPGGSDNTGIIVVAIIMGIASVIGTAIGGWYTFRAARKNAQATKEIEQDKLSTTSWEAQVEAWRTDVVELRKQRAEDRQEYNTHKLNCAEQISELSRKLAGVIDAHDRDRREYHE